MNLKFTQLTTLLAFSTTLFAGTPVIDGTFDGESVWGTPVAIGDGNPGFGDAEGNARKLYVTYDANYVYFGAECKAQFWHQFIFAVHTKPGGGSEDSWSRSITYNHANKPDFLFRGNIDNQTGRENYAEYHTWNGTSWDGVGISVNPGPGKTEVRGLFNGSREGFIEIRVPISAIGHNQVGDVQFLLTGDNNDHGVFDAIPTDNVAGGWNSSSNKTSVSNYVANVVLPASLSNFSGELRGNAVQLQWNTLTETNLSGFNIERSTDANTWQSVGFVPALNNPSGSNYQYSVQKSATAVSFFRLKITDNDGSFSHSKMVVIKSQPNANAELIGNPVQSTINVAIHTQVAERIEAELIDLNGRRVNTQVFSHPGGSSIMQIPVPNLRTGMYILRLSGSEIKETLKVIKSL
jgi:hypothetical protein